MKRPKVDDKPEYPPPTFPKSARKVVVFDLLKRQAVLTISTATFHPWLTSVGLKFLRYGLDRKRFQIDDERAF